MVLRLRVPAPDWKAGGNEDRAAKCKKFGPDITGEDPWCTPEQYEDALAVCNGDIDGRICPIRDACLRYACANNEAHGVWGGMLPHDRHNLRQQAKADAGGYRVPWKEVEWIWHPPTDPVTPVNEDELYDEDEEDDPPSS